MGSTRITIVRHGETEWNKALKLQGHLDSPLTEMGVKQAELLAETIQYKTYDVCYSSDAGRALHTAKIINEHLRLEIIKSDQLRERAFGFIEGQKREALERDHPEALKAFLERDPDFSVKDGESLKQFSKRIITEIDRIAKENTGKRILLIAHGGVLDCIIRRVFGIGLQQKRCFTIFNTSVNTITIHNCEWVLEEWGNVEHLHQHKALDEI